MDLLKVTKIVLVLQYSQWMKFDYCLNWHSENELVVEAIVVVMYVYAMWQTLQQSLSNYVDGIIVDIWKFRHILKSPLTEIKIDSPMGNFQRQIYLCRN